MKIVLKSHSGWFADLSKKAKLSYLKLHPNSKFKATDKVEIIKMATGTVMQKSATGKTVQQHIEDSANGTHDHSPKAVKTLINGGIHRDVAQKIKSTIGKLDEAAKPNKPLRRHL